MKLKTCCGAVSAGREEHPKTVPRADDGSCIKMHAAAKVGKALEFLRA